MKLSVKDLGISFSIEAINDDNNYVLHKPLSEITENSQLTFKVSIISDKDIKEVRIKGNNSEQEYFDILMAGKDDFSYKAVLNNKYTKIGFLNYSIVISYTDGNKRTFPADVKGGLYDWDFYYNQKVYSSKVVSQNSPIYLMLKKTQKTLFDPGESHFDLYLPKTIMKLSIK